MRLLYLLFLCLPFAEAAAQKKITKIAFGSCGSQSHPLPILGLAAKQQPDWFIFLGDNIYGDTKDMQVLQSKYEQLGANPNYQKLKKSTQILATWDDHDYGANDAGKEYTQKRLPKSFS